MPTHAKYRSRAARWLALALGTSALVACVGTPTPEPPDLLPRPEISILTTVSAPEYNRDNALEPIEFNAPPGSVPAGADVWIVNLDSLGSQPVTAQAEADGSFEVTIRNASPEDRIRFVARRGNRHSLPLDLQVTVLPGDMPGLMNLLSQELGCLELVPEEELTVVVDDAEVEQRFVLENRCDEAVTIDRAELRFGGQGITLEAPPSRIAAGDRTELNVRFARHDQRVGRTDILLLDVESGEQRGRYALGLWSIAASSLGND